MKLRRFKMGKREAFSVVPEASHAIENSRQGAVKPHQENQIHGASREKPGPYNWGMLEFLDPQRSAVAARQGRYPRAYVLRNIPSSFSMNPRFSSIVPIVTLAEVG